MNIFERFKRWIIKITSANGTKWIKAVIFIIEGTKKIFDSPLKQTITNVLTDKFPFITGPDVDKIEKIVYTILEKWLFQFRLIQKVSGVHSMEEKVELALKEIQLLDKSKKAEFWLNSAIDIRLKINEVFEDGKLTVQESKELIQTVYDTLKKDNEL